MASLTTRDLDVAVDAARAAGAVLGAAFHGRARPEGTRAKDPVDAVAEGIILDRLAAAFPDDGVRGEELPERVRAPTAGVTRRWLIDPQDGTSAYHDGWRGPAVSIGLVEDGRPVLGVVLAYAAPDAAGDLVTWGEGLGPVCRNGDACPAPARGQALGPEDTVLVSHRADRAALPNARAVAPARFLPAPSIAWRLARVAAGDGAAATSLGGPDDYDVAAGHALLRGAGLELVDRHGEPVGYGSGPQSVGDCFGGQVDVARALASQDWSGIWRSGGESPTPWDPVLPAFGEVIADPGVLARAQGCLLGQLVGDALGSHVEFQRPEDLRRAWPGGIRELMDGGTWDTLAGQPTDDSELALMLARALIAGRGFDRARVLAGYAHWYRSGPYDCGATTAAALGAAARADDPVAAAARAANQTSQANGALMRVSPLGVFGHAMAPARLAELARQDAALTHPHPVCQDASALFAVTLAHAIRTGDGPEATLAAAFGYADALGVHPDVRTSLEASAEGPPADMIAQMGWVRKALQNTFHVLREADGVEAGLVRTVMLGGDTDTNGAIAGALLGAVYGRSAVPARWVDRVLTCRPMAGLAGVRRPRARSFWPVDAMILADRLAALGRTAA